MDISDSTSSNPLSRGFWDSPNAQKRSLGFVVNVSGLTSNLARLIAWCSACWAIVVCLHVQSRDISSTRNYPLTNGRLDLCECLPKCLHAPLILSSGAQSMGCESFTLVLVSMEGSTQPSSRRTTPNIWSSGTSSSG